MEIEITGVHNPMNHRGQIHSRVRSNEGSNLVAPIVCQFFGYTVDHIRLQ